MVSIPWDIILIVGVFAGVIWFVTGGTYNFQIQEPSKRYGRLKRGWHAARIHQASLKSTRSGALRQYINAEFEIIREKQYRDILVPGFFNYNKNGKPDPRFLDMGKAAGLRENYANVYSVLRDLIGKELSIYVVHRYKKGQRRERAEDFRPLAGA